MQNGYNYELDFIATDANGNIIGIFRTVRLK
jgi:hypothetical protein